MYILTEELEIENTCLLIDAALIEVEPPAPAPVILLYTPVAPAPVVAIQAGKNPVAAAMNDLTTIITKDTASPYKRKYERASDILQYLATTSTRKEVASLYWVNATLIEATPQLREAFATRKAVFFPYQPAVA